MRDQSSKQSDYTPNVYRTLYIFLGTRFYDFQCMNCNSEATKWHFACVPTKRQDSLMNRSATVLLVEDNEMEQTLARRAIGRAGMDCKVVLAADGAEACQTLFDRRLKPVNLVLLDLHLPKL